MPFYTKCRYTGKKLLGSGLKLIGGKTKTRDIFYNLFPDNIEHYIEPFLGSANVLVGTGPYNKETVGDVNTALINFLHCLQTKSQELWQAITRDVNLVTTGERAAWINLRDNEPTDPINNASWFYCVTKYSMNGIFRRNKSGKCNSSFCKTVKGRGIYTKTWFDTVVKRLEHTSIIESSYPKLLNIAQNSNNSFVFLDPPYRLVKTVYNGIKFSDQDHIDMKLLLDKANYKWMQTINDDLFVRTLYKDYNIIEHSIFYSCSQTAAGRSARPELIITNYKCQNLTNVRE